MLKRFLVAKKNQVQSKSVPEMAFFRKFKGRNIKYSHWELGPRKGTSLPGTTSFDVFCINIRPGV